MLSFCMSYNIVFFVSKLSKTAFDIFIKSVLTSSKKNYFLLKFYFFLLLFFLKKKLYCIVFPHITSKRVSDFNTRNELLTQKLLKQSHWYMYHKLRKTFSKFYRRYYDLISKFEVGLKSLLSQGLSESEFYSDLVYKLKKIVGFHNFSAQFIKIISHYKKIDYNINVLQQTAGLVVKIVGEYDQEIPQSQTADNPMAP